MRLRRRPDYKCAVGDYIDEAVRADYIVRYYRLTIISGVPIPGSDLDDIQFVHRSDIAALCSEAVKAAWPPRVVKLLNA